VHYYLRALLPTSRSLQFLTQTAAELQQLPPGAAIEQMLADYQVLRDQARACP
jgi:hypothetical protein